MSGVLSHRGKTTEEKCLLTLLTQVRLQRMVGSLKVTEKFHHLLIDDIGIVR